jgi:hypothetical protein
MKPVTQEHMHDPANGVNGDCFRACLASIFEEPLSEVPHFMAMPEVEWWFSFLDWLAEHGVAPLEIRIDDGVGIPAHLDNCATILSGYTRRNPGVRHAVVGKGERQVHDPHPSREGLAEVCTAWLFVAIAPEATP